MVSWHAGLQGWVSEAALAAKRLQDSSTPILHHTANQFWACFGWLGWLVVREALAVYAHNYERVFSSWFFFWPARTKLWRTSYLVYNRYQSCTCAQNEASSSTIHTYTYELGSLD